MNWAIIVLPAVVVVLYLVYRYNNSTDFPENQTRKSKGGSGRILITTPDDVRNLLHELYGAHFGGGNRKTYRVRVDALKWNVDDHTYARTLKQRLQANPMERVIVDFIHLRRTPNDYL